MQIVMNADDFGIDIDRDIGILWCVLTKRITSVSVIVTNKIGVLRRIMVKLMKKNADIGIHINLTDNPLTKYSMEELCNNTTCKYIKPKFQFWESSIQNELDLNKIEEENYKLPDMIVSTEYLNFNDQKFSKSKGIGMTILEAIEQLNIDTLRFHLIKNGTEKKDTNFTIEDYKATHNEITNKLGNFVNRTLKYKGIEYVPHGNMDKEFKKKIDLMYSQISQLMERLEFREIINTIMNFLDEANKYYDERKPWIQAKEDIESFNDTIYTCSNIIVNIANFIEPFMPETASKIRKYLKVEEADWKYTEVEPNLELADIEALFERMK